MKKLPLSLILTLLVAGAVFGQSNPPLKFREVDGAPSKTNATEFVLPNGTLTVAGGRVTYTPAGGGSGDALKADPLSQFAATTSLQLLGVISNETGTGLLVFNDTPTLIAPLLGTPTSGVLTNLTGLPPTTGIVGWPANASGVLTNNGSGVLTWGAGGSGANTALSNLASVDINTDLLFQATAGVGTAAKPALALFVGNTTQYESVVQSAGLITHAALGSATNIGIAFTAKGASAIQLNNTALFATGSVGVPSITFTAAATSGFYLGAGSSINVPISGVNVLRFISAEVRMANTVLLSWGSGTPEATAGDVALSRNGPAQIQINNGTAGQWGSLFAGVRDAGTTTVTNGLTLGHQSTGTPAAGLGSAVQFNINSSTTADRSAGQHAVVWQDATDATRSADHVFSNVLGGAALAETFRIKANGLLVVPQTITAGGTTGNRTINLDAGTVNIAAAGTTVTVTNALCSTSSTVYAMIRTNDSTARIANVVPGAGSFVINLTAAATGEISIGWWVLN